MFEIAGGIILAWLIFVFAGGVLKFLAQRHYDRYGNAQDQWEAKKRREAIAAKRKRDQQRSVAVTA